MACLQYSFPRRYFSPAPRRNQIGGVFGFQPRTSSALCKKWVEAGFLEMVNRSNKARKYKLAKPYDILAAGGR